MKKRTIPRELLKEDIGWLAGIIDGECSIVYGRLYKKDQCKVYWGLHLVNTNVEMIEKFIRIAEIICYPHKESIKLKEKKYFSRIVGTKPCYQITLRKKDVLQPILFAVIPHLTEKRKRAEVLLNFLSNHQKNARYTELDIKRLVETK